MATEQQIRNAERRAENLKKSGAVTKLVIPTRGSTTSGFTSMVPPIPASPEAEAFSRASGNAFLGSSSTRPPAPPRPSSSGNQGGSSGSGGSSSSGGMTATEALAQAKFNYEKEQDAKKLTGLQNYFDSGSFNSNFDNLLKMITAQDAAARGDVTNAYNRAMTGINEGYDVAQGLGDKGFANLSAYLLANQNNPYANMRAQTGTAPDALTNYLNAYGVSDQPVQGQIAADQMQSGQSAANYQNLINTLSAIAQQSAGSRGTESEMSQLLFNTGLGQDRAGYRTQAENAQAQALAQLAAQMAERQFGVESNRGTVAQQLAQTIAELGGNSNNSNGNNNNDGNNNSPTSPAVEELLREIAARQEAGTQSGGGRGNLMDMF